jgi:hypothetical protein
MKFILSFLIITSALSADTCFKLSLGNAALTPSILCNPVNIFTPVTPLKCPLPSLQLPTEAVIKCDLPTSIATPAPIVTKCAPIAIICPPVVAPVIECPKSPITAPKCDPTPTVPNCATPEPSSYALLGAGLMTAGVARKLRNKK